MGLTFITRPNNEQNPHAEFIICLDVGFAQEANESCGLALCEFNNTNPTKIEIKRQRFNFSEACNKIFELIKKNENITLIIEAPLSHCFSNENPQKRCIDNNYDYVTSNNSNLIFNERITNTNYHWYYGAAAAVSMGAIILIKSLLDKSEKNSVHKKIFLIEAFSVNKPKNLGPMIKKINAENIFNFTIPNDAKDSKDSKEAAIILSQYIKKTQGINDIGYNWIPAKKTTDDNVLQIKSILEYCTNEKIDNIPPILKINWST